MSLGEWWIDADGDAGVEVPNHDCVVADRLARDVLGALGLEKAASAEHVGNLDVWAEADEENADALREARFVGGKLLDLAEHPALVLLWPDEERRKAGVQAAHGGGAPSDYAVRYMASPERSATLGACTRGTMARKRRGVIYLLHFDRPLAHARHYLGWTSDLAGRLEAHAAGQGARLTEVLREQGIGWTLSALWRGSRTDERRLKRRKESPRLCPLCSPCPKDSGLPAVRGMMNS